MVCERGVHRLLLAARLEADVAGDDAHVARELALHVRHLLRDHVVRRLPPPREGHREPELPQVVGGGARAVVDDEDDAAVEVAVLGPPRRLAEQLLVPQREAALAAHVLDVHQHDAVRGLEADQSAVERGGRATRRGGGGAADRAAAGGGERDGRRELRER